MKLFTQRLRKRETGEYITIGIDSENRITPDGEGAHLLQTDVFAIHQAAIRSDFTHYERIGDVIVNGRIM